MAQRGGKLADLSSATRGVMWNEQMQDKILSFWAIYFCVCVDLWFHDVKIKEKELLKQKFL